jgi:hypothetical protein
VPDGNDEPAKIFQAPSHSNLRFDRMQSTQTPSVDGGMSSLEVASYSEDGHDTD